MQLKHPFLKIGLYPEQPDIEAHLSAPYSKIALWKGVSELRFGFHRSVQNKIPRRRL